MAALLDRVTVTAEDSLGKVMFGFPLDWLAQDRSASRPPLPAAMAPTSPWENPTSVELGPLLADVLVIYAVLVAGWFIARTLVRRFGGGAR